MTKRILSLSIICIFLVINAQPQSLDATLKIYASQYAQERVHIHFDKDAYLPGETIWMKAYILAGAKPSDRSKNIYFDWTDVNGNLIFHSISPVKDGVSTSSFVIPPNFRTAAIHVKAYTQWMLNFDSAFLYNKEIPVLTPWDGTSARPEKHVAVIRFFPEGGDLVTNLTSVVAFETMDQFGKPVLVRGLIKNNENQVIDSFLTKHNGMGYFKLHPLSNVTYTAYWTDEFGESHTTGLPLSKPIGIIVRVNPSAGNIKFQIERVTDCPDNLKTLTIMVISHQDLVYKSAVDLTSKSIADGYIQTDKFPNGVIQITILDANRVPVAERVVFVNNHQSEFITQVKNELTNFTKKGKNEISIELPDSLSANLSVSVTDGSLGIDSSSNIISDFLMSSDIRGNIINPAYYFSNSAEATINNTDLVMLTHGWRRFKWEDVVAGKLPVIQYPVESDYMVLKGQLSTAPNTHFQAGDSIRLLVVTRDLKKHFLVLPLSPDGSFIQKGMFFYDSMQILYQPNRTARLNSGSGISFQTSLLPGGLTNVRAGNPVFQWSKVPELILDKELNGELTEINNYSKETPCIDCVFTPDYRKDSLKSNFETAFHYLSQNFPDLRFPVANDNAPNSTDSKYASFTLNKTTAAPATKSNVNVMLDGTLVNSDDLKQVNTKDILFIKFLEKNASTKGLPTLSITTRQSVDQNNILNNKTGLAVLKGYTSAKEYYSPQYSMNAGDDQIIDFRSTLYWNPSVILDKNHRKIKLVFYNNDISNKFRVVVEGFNKEGKLTRMEQIIK